MMFETICKSPEDTFALGRRIGRNLQGGEVLELASDLGGGKTVLVKGIAAGLGYAGEVSSPTFTISRVYQLPSGLELHHFDFYRVASGDIVGAELAEVAGEPDVIVAVEWAGNIPDALPADRIRIEIAKQADGARQITIKSLGSRHHHVAKDLPL